MVSRVGPVIDVTETGAISDIYVYRSSLVPTINTDGISLTATDAALRATLGATLAHGTFLNAATARYPAVVLGAEAASLLGINNLANPTQIWIGGGRHPQGGGARLPDGQHGLHRISDRRAVLRFRRGVGIANVMVISVLERRSEVGLRRALGASRRHVAEQFLAEALLLSVLGGVAGTVIGAAATVIYAVSQHWSVQIPAVALYGGVGAALVIGAVAGLYPSMRAARLSPTEALRTV